MFRWSWPFGSKEYMRRSTKNGTLQLHRKIDGIKEKENVKILDRSRSRVDYMTQYTSLMAEKNKYAGKRWFDKTPQHVYGLLLIAAEFPDSKIINIYRNPLNVVASLKRGKVMKEDNIIAAANYWREAIMIFKEYEKGHPDRTMNVAYEELTQDPAKHLNAILTFVGEEEFFNDKNSQFVKPEANRYREILSEKDIAVAREVCDPVVGRFGLSFEDY